MTDYIAYIGRFQPITNAHLHTMKNALKQTETLIIAVGSHRATPSIRNPWSYEQRVGLISSCFTSIERDHIVFIPIRDYLYSDTMWITELQHKVSNIVGDHSCQLIGHFKDDSSYYLKFFPQWPLIEEPPFLFNDKVLNASDVRELLWGDFISISNLSDMVPYTVMYWLTKQYMNTEAYKDMCAEYKYIQEYKKSWSTAPYPPTFVTADAVVVQSGHILLIKRKVNPGKGLWALPGGFVNNNEKIEDCALRELKEETSINVSKIILKKSIIASHVFDHPGRSLRGRTITHAYLISLEGTKPLPKIKAADDAAGAHWVPFNDMSIYEDQFFEDHFQIINFLLRKV